MFFRVERSKGAKTHVHPTPMIWYVAFNSPCNVAFDASIDCLPAYHTYGVNRRAVYSERRGSFRIWLSGRRQRRTVSFFDVVPNLKKVKQNLLRALQRDRRNFVFDSVYPHLAPHIVVTPPEYTWEDFFIPSQNRVDLQWRNYLTVPPQTWHSPSSTHVSRSKDRTRSKDISAVGTDWSSGVVTDEGEPCRVFSHEEFAESVQQFGFYFLTSLCAHLFY
jgi:hypothetical protein